jgi:hypothetical protein
LLLGTANVDGWCRIRVTLTVPDVPAGTYTVLPVIAASNNGGWTSGTRVAFRVT